MLDHLAQFPHRNNPDGIRKLQEAVNKYSYKIQEHEAQLEEIEGDRPVKSALPQLGNNGRIDITQGDSRLKRAMDGAVLARQTRREEVKEEALEISAPEIAAQQQSSSLLNSLNSSLGNFVVGVASVINNTHEYTSQYQTK